MRIEIFNRFDGGWVVADDDLNNALSETSARTPVTDPPRRKTPPAKTAAARSAVVPRGLESLARAGIGRAVLARARSCGIDTDVWCSPVSSRVVAAPGRGPAFTVAI
jgi:hypothetical protein